VRRRLAQLSARLGVRVDRAVQEGVWRTSAEFLGAAAAGVVWALLLPVTMVLHLAGFRRLTVLVGRIGHLAAEPDSFLKARALGMVGPGRYFMLAPRRAVANAAMLDYWRSRISVIEKPALCWVIGAMSRWMLMKHDMSRYVLKLDASQDIYRINAAWRGRPPLLSLSDADAAWSDSQFAALGLPRDAWFVCVHFREPGFSPADESAHSYRNSDPRASLPAMAEIVRRGGWCVRMGDPTMTQLETMPGVIDYAHHPLRSARLDVLLCARARFFLGNTSGLTLVSSAFGVPSALANLVPVSVQAFLPSDIGIPKLVRELRTGRPLSFADLLCSPMGDFRYSRLYRDAGIEAVENTPEEILELVVEMLDRLEGTHEPVLEDEVLQRRFMSLFRPGHYAYGTAARVGGAFLRRHRDLLPAD
jgi:putative glycosyltransferase (TIGR04372 family)